MRLLQKPFKNAKKGQTIEVTFDKPTNVKFMTATNFTKYKKGNTHTYYGGFQEESPVEFVIPKNGTWHAVIEKGTFSKPLEVSGNAILKDAPEGLNSASSSKAIEASEEEEESDESVEIKEEAYAEVEEPDDSTDADENDEEDESKED